MQISRDEVARVATLARLALTDGEAERLRGELSSILGYVAQLDRLDLAAIPPSAQVIPVTNVTRSDVARPSIPRDLALANAPAAEDGFFRVPAVFDEPV